MNVELTLRTDVYNYDYFIIRFIKDVGFLCEINENPNGDYPNKKYYQTFSIEALIIILDLVFDKREELIEVIISFKIDDKNLFIKFYYGDDEDETELKKHFSKYLTILENSNIEKNSNMYKTTLLKHKDNILYEKFPQEMIDYILKFI